MASSLPSLQVRKGSAVNEFLGRLIEKMAEVGTRSSMTSNHERGHAHHHHMHVRATYTDVTIIMWPLIPDPFLHHSCTLPPTTTITQWKQYYATRLVFFFARTKSSSYIPLSAKKKYTIVMKKVHEQVAKIITSVFSEFRHMTTSFFRPASS